MLLLINERERKYFFHKNLKTVRFLLQSQINLPPTPRKRSFVFTFVAVLASVLVSICWASAKKKKKNPRGSKMLFFPHGRYSISRRRDTTRAFKIDPYNGTISMAKALDRETAGWHNFTVEAKETGCNTLMTC